MIPLLTVALVATLAGCQGDAAKADPVTLTAFLRNGATVEQRNAVDGRIRSFPSVQNITHTTKEQAYTQFKQLYKNSPDLVAQTRPDALPESFSATLTNGALAEAAAAVMRSLPGVDDTNLAPGPGSEKAQYTGVVIYLKDEATKGERNEIEARIRTIPGIRQSKFESKEKAYARFRDVFSKQPGLAKAVDRKYAAASFRIKIAAGKNNGAGIDSLRRLSGVATMRMLPDSAL